MSQKSRLKGKLMENDFQGAFKHLTSSFVTFTEEHFSEHQLKIAWYKRSCCHKAIVMYAVTVNSREYLMKGFCRGNSHCVDLRSFLEQKSF